ncbi:non-ribosomal peptide synthase/polyketide synthase [Scytonema hofmannii]
MYPLSPMQEGMLFESLYTPNSGVYFEQIICKFTGNLNVKAFERAWQMVVARHSVFRTAFIWESLNKPIQVVYRQVQVTVNTIDWRKLTKVEQQAQLETFLSSEQQQGLQLSQAPLMRLHLLHLDELTYQFVWCFHHILLDGWSLPLVFQDLFEYYQAIADGVNVALQPTRSYRNYIAWLQQQDLNSAKEFWRQKLQGFSAPTPLTVDKPLSNREHSRYGDRQIHLTPSTTSQAVDFVKQHQLTMNNLVQATWGLLLSRYSQETDVVFGATVSGRPPGLLGVESMVGLFINTVPVRLQISPETSLLDLLKDLQAQQVESTQFSYCSLVEIQGLSDVPRGTSLFESIVVFENYPVDTDALQDSSGLTVENFPGIEHTNYPLTIIAVLDEQLLLKVSYDTTRFELETIERMLGHFVTLLEAIVANPQQRISQLPLLTASEQHQLLVEWNETSVDYPHDKCIHQLFEEQVARTPDAVAVVYENQRLTYGELNCRANQLAHYLQSLGVGANVLVGICVERASVGGASLTLLMVVGLLGILKAGGAYVPLDPEYPSERLAAMAEDAQISVLLTTEKLATRIPYRGRVICYERDFAELTLQSQENLTPEVRADGLAYVIYTSGSTGKPKGVSVTHQGVNRLVMNTNYIHIEPLDVIAQASNYAFDAATFEIWGALLHGARLIGVSKEVALSPSYFAALIREQGISVLFLTTALFNQIAQVAPSAFNSLRYLLFGGEAVDPKWVQEVLKHGRPQRLLHVYGPTENTTFTSWYLVQDVPKDATTIPIGRPIANTLLYILDKSLQPVPIGVPGELHIGGEGLARGYLNRPELTQEKFIPNPFRKSRGVGAQGCRVLKEDQSCSERLYKTGDLARYLPDGNIEYLGRIDNQVKIRGFRIELGEIEAVLSQHEHVQVCCAIARVDTPGDKRLVAYIVPHPQQIPTVSVLRSFLTKKLPEYMVPSAIVILESLPLTPNGKVDRRALKAPEPSRELSDKFVAPRTPIEEMLALHWAQVLKVELVGRNDNFFEMGGHSLLATQLVSRIRKIFQVELPLRSIFARPTLAELAQEIQQLQQQDVELADSPILPRAENAELPLSFAQQRLWFLDRLEPLSASYNIPAALRLQGTLCVAALEKSLVEIIHRHEALRTNFITVDGKATQLIHTNPNWKVSVVDLKHLPSSEQEIAAKQLARLHAIEPFDLTTEALIRATLVVLSQTEHVLLVCMHHVVSDGWSIGVFVAEFTTLYNAYCEGKPSPLLPLPIQYADFAIWQRQWLQGDVLQSQLNYWLQQLTDAPTFLPLPTDRPRGAVQTFNGAYLEFALSVELTQKLTLLSQEQGCTLFMTLLAAFNTLLYRYTGQADILVGSPIANRHRSEIESLIGFFVNTLVFRTDLSGNPSFNELLLRIRSMALSAYAHQDLPFEMLVEALQPERDLSHTPLFQVMFVLQNAPTSVVELTGLTVSSLPIETTTAKFDLTLSMENTPTGLVGAWEYNTDLFDRLTIERIAKHFMTLLEAIVTNPGERISQLPLLTESEQQQLLVEWNDTLQDYPQDKCIHQLFEEQVVRTPNAVAVVYENQQLTYNELNCRANQLAHYLRSSGVRAGVLVGICMERSVSMVVGLLGILKAGGVYVPLDPEYPTQRLVAIVESAQVSVLLTADTFATALPQQQARVICYNTASPELACQSEENPTPQASADALAYVIYTSGSTGQPKGVSVTHQGVTRLVMNTNYIHIEASDAIAQASNYAFDAATFEIWGALLHGARLFGVSKELALSPINFAASIREQGITVLFLTTALFNQIAQAVPNAFNPLRYLLFGGEAVEPKWVQQVLKNGAPQRLLHVYGPTENTTFSSWYWVQDVPKDATTIPIGRPIANTQIYILDEYLQPVPVGVPGELHIGGAGLATGYLNRSELTAEKFITNPFNNPKSQIPNPKLYKTGDLARYLSDGNIEYLGRIDNQVKIRGFRIELGEIEAVLSQNEHVRSSCVIARVDTPGDKRLVAYIVPQKQVIPTSSELRQFLKAKLPEYMVPSAFVILEFLPLTNNGKVDRRALPVPESRTGIENTFVAPRTPIEEKLASIWAQVLRVEPVGIHDNFFELGGDSILSIQIIAKAKLAGIELSLKQLFANQTIAELATVALTTKALFIEQELVTGVSPLTPIQQWFFEQQLPQMHHFNQSFLLTVPTDIKIEFLEVVWKELLKHHDALRLQFTQTESNWLAIHAENCDRNVVSCFDFSTLSDSEQQKAMESTANSLQASLNLSENLVQVALFRLGVDKGARLLIIIHHLVVDGVSWRILLEDLVTGYRQLCEGKAIQLPAKTTSFKDWAQHLREYAQSHRLTSELDYWLSVSNSASPPLPVDHADGMNTVASASTISVSLNVAQTRSLLQDVPKAYKTQINDVLLTALLLVVSRWTHSKSVLLNLEGHGREDIIEGVDLSRTVGWFTTIFPVVLKLSDPENLGQVLKSVKEQLRAIPNKGIGYGLLRYLNQEIVQSAQLATVSKAQISFNYLGQFTQVLNTESLISPATESSGQFQSLQGQRSTSLDINAIIADQQLQIHWTYSRNLHEHATIEHLASEFVCELQNLIAHCLEPDNVGYTPTDFPLIQLNQSELDLVLAKLAFKTESGRVNQQNLEDIYPLSPMQAGMLFESLYAPDTGVYFEQITCTFAGNLNVRAFEQAWQMLVARHSIFRTAFEWESLSTPVQVVYRQLDVNVNTLDWRGLTKTEQQAQLETFLLDEQKQGFQLHQAPLMRLHLLQLDESIYQFVWCHHHILLDGWSLPLVFQDLFAFYQAICDGGSVSLPQTVNYRNYIAWLEQQDLDAAKEFWRQKLLGFSAPTPLRVDKPLSNTQQHSGYSEQQIQLTVSATEKAVSFVKQHQLTLNNLVQVSWGLLLSRYSGETDVVFGATVSGRPPALLGVESMVGIFINTVPVRLQIFPQTDLLDLLKDLQTQHVDSGQFSYCSLVEIQGLSDIPRGKSLFDSIVVFENYPVDAGTLQDNGGLTLSNFRGIEHTNYPLTVVAGLGEQLWLKVSYDTNRFDRETINRMLGHFVTLLEAIVANPQQPIEQLPLLTASEQQQLLLEWNDTQVDYPVDKCIHQLFEEQVARNPNAVAVVFEDQQLTYGELNSHANQLAHYLRSAKLSRSDSLGVGANVLVGICVERSLSMVVGLLAILKAGGAYVPLDPEYPTERLNFVLEDAQVSVLLTQQHLVAKFASLPARVVCLDTQWHVVSQFSRENPATVVSATDLAYAIYTSGSTGTPKGVPIAYEGLLNLVFWHQRTFEIASSDRATQLAGTGFDAAVWEIWPYLSAGASLYLVKSELVTEPENLQQWLTDNQITIAFVPTPVAIELLSLEWTTQGLALRYLLTGGDKLHQYPSPSVPFSVVNNYGPTENTVVTTSGLVVAREQSQISPPIGRPIANTQVYILDKHLQPVPIGVPGELHISGASLAKGYLNRPELTAEKFIPNPFRKSRGAGDLGSRVLKEDQSCSERLYKTGDLARFLSDGNIEYIGRIDNQVKIRGFRIELGEIEAVLSQHEHVQANCVTVSEDRNGDKCLVAYTVPQKQATPTISQLRQFLKAKLPEYMVPNAFVFLEALPLTPNGKVARRALPTPDKHSKLQPKYVAPRTPVEEMLAQLWAQVLKIELIGIYDNFFELGGHSLLATQLISRIRSVFKVELPLRSLFVTPTVSELALSIQQKKQEKVELTNTPILPRSESAELPLSFAQQRLWFLDRLEPLSSSYNMSVAFLLVGNLRIPALEKSFIEIIHRHEALRTNFITVDGQATQLIHTDLNWTVSVVDLQHLSPSEQEIASRQLAQQQALEPFDLSNATLLRAKLVVLSQTEHVLLVCMHHIVCDGWSMGVFVEELAALYNAYVQDQPLPLAPLPIQYADFAIWQRQWLQGDVLQSQLNYWLQQLENAPTFLPLPTDRPRGAVQTFAGAYQKFALSLELTQKLTRLSQEQGCTLFMTLLAAFDTLLYRYTGVADILVGSPIANRHRSEIEGLIGFFVNTLVLRADLSGNPGFNELLSRIRSMALSAYAYQDLPFEMLVEALQPERDLSHTPLFQVMFVLQNAPTSVVELTGLTVNSLPVEIATTKFDLTLSMENTPTGLVGGWEYNTDLFDSSTIERMIGHFVTLLEAIVANPTERIDQLPLLTPTEQQQLLVEWNDTRVDYPIDKCIHQLFEEQVARTPDAVAIVFEDQQLTYDELNSRANQLAHYLQSLGVKPDVLVGICVERSLSMVVGMLGILKAGGAYVPLDPAYPQERLGFMLYDAGVSVLVTQQHLVEQLPEHNAQVVCLDTHWQLISLLNQKNSISGVQVSNLAYVIYTSGSTGQPKGVQISHNSVGNFLYAMQQRPGITKQDILLGITTIAFDIAALEIFLPITVGARLVIARREVTFDGRQLLDLLVKSQATLVQATPATWRLLLKANYQSSHLKILCGGEALPWELAHQLCTRSASLWNLYGPTETTIWSSVYQVESKENLISIGRAIANTQFYVLDQNLQPVPVGIPGELHIGGAGLARGYLNRPDLTQQKFIPNPFRRSRGAGKQGSRGVKEDQSCSERLYKTGDLVRYRPDGNIEYLGRMDNQVKIRGFRIELGEIEALLSQHHHVQANCVIVREDTPGDLRLVAYIVPHTDHAPTPHSLRSFLKQKLPDYMVPNAIVILESLPLTNNGKVDRRALKAPVHSSGSDTFVSPRNTVELQLVQIWSQILQVDNVGVKDNFFDLGGHSLLAVHLMTQMKQQFGKDIPLAMLFQHPTIEDLAVVVQKDTDTSPWSPLVAIQPTGSNPPLFCVPGAGGFPFYLYNLARCLGPDQPFYSFQAQSRDGELAKIGTVEEIACDYIQAMQAVQPQGPYFLGGHSFGGKVVLEMAKQLLLQGQVVTLVAIFDTTAPIVYGEPQESDDATWLINIAKSLQMAFAKNLEMDAEPLRSLATPEQLKYVLEYLHLLEVVPPNADTTYLKHLLQAYKANNTTVYLPQQVNPVPITLFRASESSIEEQTALESKFSQDLSWGWSEFSNEPVDIHFVPGNHISMMTQPHVQVLAERLNACIKKRKTPNAVD